MKLLLSLSDIEFHRDEFTLQIDTLKLGEGCLYQLQGPNGAGKSTLLQLLALLLVPERGQLKFQGQTVSTMADRQRLRQQITRITSYNVCYTKLLRTQFSVNRLPQVAGLHR